jgi:hypothetical protein
MDRLSRSPAYAAQLSDDLLQLTGVDLDFGDCSMPADRRVDAHINIRALQREVAARILLEQADALPELVHPATRPDITTTH